ncbi:UDP-glucuronate 5-epimerase, partial [Mycobacterium tuberculosis]|nr:UDP-glucuronate 5-epimerase [Mycobacterium tuberculosis]
VVNIAGGQPVGLDDFIATIERCLGRPAIRTLLPMQKGDVVETHADAGLLEALTGFVPAIAVEDGVAAFVDWYRSHYEIGLVPI